MIDLSQPAAKHRISPHSDKTSVEINILINKEGEKYLQKIMDMKAITNHFSKVD